VANALIKEVTDSNFEQEVNQSSMPVLVDFWAPWCRPCLQLAPVLDELAAAFPDKLLIVKVNVDENRSITAKHDIRGIPALVLFRDGKVLGRTTGLMHKTKIMEFLDEHLHFIGVGG